MKRNTILLWLALICGLTLFSCKKQEQEALTPKITNDKVETTATTATFTWTVDWPGKLISVVEVSENEDMSHSQRYGSDAETENHDFTVTVTDLKEATKYYYRHVVWNHFYVDNKFVMEVKSFTTKTDVPKVKTVEVTDVTRTTATVIGEVTDECGFEVTERGVCWSTSHEPTTSGSHLNSGTGTGSYSIAISNLEVGKTYYVRAYAKNSNGTAYGEELDFVTGDAVKPTVTTAEVTNIDWRTATGGGEVTDDGNATVTERGVCWSTSHNPEVSGAHASNGTGPGSYTVNMTGLTAGTTYYVRAYAKNIAGLSYGNEVSFETKAPELPVVTTSNPTDITRTAVMCGGDVSSDGGVEVIERGVCWSTNPDLDISGSHFAAAESGTGNFAVPVTGLMPNTSYYICSYATNSVGTSYGTTKSFSTLPIGKPTVTTAQVSNVTTTTATGGGNVTDDGGSEVTERGICWGAGHNPSLTENLGCIHSGTGTGEYTMNMTGLSHGTKYYVRAYAKNNVDIGYGAEVEFTTLAEAPIVTTNPVTDITLTTAKGWGEVVDDGGATVTERGVCWSTSPNPTINNSHASGGTGTGSYSVSMTGLSMATVYYVKAYARNSADISYGSETSFTTATPQAPTGAINGLFSVSENKQVWFSQGNLQYIGSASPPYWKFADNQWSYLGNNGQGSTNQNANRDLFGWGTSGWNNGNVYYRPWDTGQAYSTSYGPPGEYNLTGAYANSDWGVYNSISNGGNFPMLWRTLTGDEWDYLINRRESSTINGIANARFVKAKVNNVHGIIFFPDHYSHPFDVSQPIGINNWNSTDWECNSYGISDWIKMEMEGTVFLPASGLRAGADGTSIQEVDSYGLYWSTTCDQANHAIRVFFQNREMVIFKQIRSAGLSVRLVRDVE